MRRLGLWWVAVAVLLGGVLAGCGERPSGDREQIVVFVSIPPLAEFAQEVGGERVRVEVMIPAGAEPHTYESTPRQLVRLSSADLYVQVGSGLGFERRWMDRIRQVNPRMEVVDCARGITVVDGDPHIWLSLRHAQGMTRAVIEGLVRVDPSHADGYRTRGERYIGRLRELDAFLARRLEEAGVHWFVVYHPSWGYFARDYGLQQLAVEEEGKEPTARRLAGLMAKLDSLRPEKVFVSPQFDKRMAAGIAAEIHAQVREVDPLPRHYLDEMRTFGQVLAGDGTP